MKINSIYILILITHLFFSNTVLAIRHVGNGAGRHEQSLVFVWQNLSNYLKLCLASDVCSKTESEKSKLRLLILSHNEEQKRGGLNFNEKWTGPSDALFETEPTIGSIIHFNMSKLRSLDQSQSFGLADAIGLLVLSLVKHHPSSTPGDSITLVTQLKMYWGARSSLADLRQIGHSEIELLTIDGTDGFTQSILLGGGDGFVEVSELMNQQLFLKCPLSKIRIYDFYWDQPKKGKPQLLSLSLRGKVKIRCGALPFFYYNADIILSWPGIVVGGTPDDFIQSPSNFNLEIAIHSITMKLLDVH